MLSFIKMGNCINLYAELITCLFYKAHVFLRMPPHRHTRTHERTHALSHTRTHKPESSNEDGSREESGDARVVQVFYDVQRQQLKTQHFRLTIYPGLRYIHPLPTAQTHNLSPITDLKLLMWPTTLESSYVHIGRRIAVEI